MTKKKEILPRRLGGRHRRFHVRKLEGYSSFAKWARKPQTTWYVLDKANNWAVMSEHTERSLAFKVRDALERGEPMPEPPWNRKGWSR